MLFFLICLFLFLFFFWLIHIDRIVYSIAFQVGDRSLALDAGRVRTVQMRPSMLAEVTLPGKRLGANVALEGFDTAVQLQMSFAIFLASEPLRTHWTRVRSVARVRSHVNVQIASQCKLLATARFRASEPFALRVDAYVTLQVAQARKRLVASIATVRAAGR